jgi:cell division septation protein DedD
MAYGGKRGAGDRVLESKHVIGLFLLMLLFSGIFFTLGYVMGRNQYDGQVRAAMNGASRPEPVLMPKADPAHKSSKKTVEGSPTTDAFDPSTSSSDPVWDISETKRPAASEPRLEPAPRAPAVQATSKQVNTASKLQPQPVSTVSTSMPARSSKGAASAPAIPNGALVLQVAALLKQEDALGIASNLQKKHYAAYVQTPTKDKYYRVQVGPFKDQKAADAAKKGLDGEGFNAFYVKH